MIPKIVEVDEAVEAFKKLDSIQRRFFLDRLLQSRLLDYVELSAAYIRALQEKEMAEQAMKNKLIMFLSCTVAKERSPAIAKDARKLIFENEWLSGSKFGDELEKEFKG